MVKQILRKNLQTTFMTNSNLKRILIKVSGECLLGNEYYGIEEAACHKLALAIQGICKSGLEVAVVIGGGNIFRGVQAVELGLERSPADNIGMLATLMNGIALEQALKAVGCPAKTMTALDCPKVAELYHWSSALDYLSKGTTLIFVGGTGNPYFTTDTAAAMRACEIKADLLLKATKVDGVYDKDPNKYSSAKMYSSLTYTQFLQQKLEVMDATAVALCMNNKVPIFVFNMDKLGGKMIFSDLLSKHNMEP